MSDEERPLLQPSSHKLPGASIILCPAKHLCLPSKATTLIILWTAVVGAIYTIFLSGMIVAVAGSKHSNSAFVVLDSERFHDNYCHNDVQTLVISPISNVLT